MRDSTIMPRYLPTVLPENQTLQGLSAGCLIFLGGRKAEKKSSKLLLTGRVSAARAILDGG